MLSYVTILETQALAPTINRSQIRGCWGSKRAEEFGCSKTLQRLECILGAIPGKAIYWFKGPSILLNLNVDFQLNTFFTYCYCFRIFNFLQTKCFFSPAWFRRNGPSCCSTASTYLVNSILANPIHFFVFSNSHFKVGKLSSTPTTAHGKPSAAGVGVGFRLF